MVPRQMTKLTFTSRWLLSGVLRPENHSKRWIVATLPRLPGRMPGFGSRNGQGRRMGNILRGGVVLRSDLPF
jgi:hypothetical protein